MERQEEDHIVEGLGRKGGNHNKDELGIKGLGQMRVKSEISKTKS